MCPDLTWNAPTGQEIHTPSYKVVKEIPRARCLAYVLERRDVRTRGLYGCRTRSPIIFHTFNASPEKSTSYPFGCQLYHMTLRMQASRAEQAGYDRSGRWGSDHRITSLRPHMRVKTGLIASHFVSWKERSYRQMLVLASRGFRSYLYITVLTSVLSLHKGSLYFVQARPDQPHFSQASQPRRWYICLTL